jgi:phosphatidylglycerophosphatase A
MLQNEQDNSKNNIINNVAIFIATGFYSGYFPLAPGTIGTIVAIPIYFIISLFNSILYYSIIIVVLFILGIIVSSKAIIIFRQEDPSPVVFDEIVGFLVALFLIEITWWHLIAAFFIFRIFDIVKPFPAGAAEGIGKGFGIMADDLIAGIYTNLIMHLALRFL